MKNFFVVLGGMGTLATVNFLNDLNIAYRPTNDQEYLNYLVFNHASIPDRTSFILKKSDDSPFDYLKEDILQAEMLNPDFYVIACNTAHFFYKELSLLTKAPIINMIDLISIRLKSLDNNSTIGVFATEGTIQSALFDEIIINEGHEVLRTSDKLQKRINDILYGDVKSKGVIDFNKYHKALDIFKKEGADYILLGCTEASFINSKDKVRGYPLIDSEKELVKETLKKALYMQKGMLYNE